MQGIPSSFIRHALCRYTLLNTQSEPQGSGFRIYILGFKKMVEASCQVASRNTKVPCMAG